MVSDAATMNSAEEPLISRRPSPSEDDAVNDDSHDTPGVYEDTTTDSASPTLFIYFLTLSAGISGLLFGCKPLPLPSPDHTS
jgi:hypothetical protein